MMEQDILYNARILIVDDQDQNIRLLQAILERAGYTHSTGTTDPRVVLTLFEQEAPDLILLDLTMPYLDGFQVMEQLHQRIPAETYLPILVLTADITRETKRRALTAGAHDFLTKPFDHMEVLLRIKNLLQTRFLHRQLQDHTQHLEEQVRSRTWALEVAQLEMLQRLAVAAEYRDDETGEHTRRVAHLAAVLARALGLPDAQVALIQRTAPLHDVGKIGIPDAILLKPGKLTADEFALMKTHTTIGTQILAGGHSALTIMAASIALTHHERWDGTGYPQGLAGEAIPLAGRIVALADTFDALTHARPYKPAWPVEEARAEIARQSGRHFDPRLAAMFLALPGPALADPPAQFHPPLRATAPLPLGVS